LTSPPVVCFDASMALAFVLQDEPLHAQAVAVVEELDSQGARLCSPALFAYEVDSVIRLRQWKGTLTEEEAEEARAILAAMSIQLEFDEADRNRAFEIARDYEQPRVYDASYAAHAQARGVELLTTDRPFFEAVGGNKKPKNEPSLSFVKLLS